MLLSSKEYFKQFKIKDKSTIKFKTKSIYFKD